MIIRREYRFEASHQLTRHPGRCQRLHGHSYRFLVDVEGPIERDQEMVLDFEDLDRIVGEEVLARLDHYHLNDVIDYPTAEWIAVWIWRALAPRLPGLRRVELFEMDGASVIYRGEDPDTR